MFHLNKPYKWTKIMKYLYSAKFVSSIIFVTKLSNAK